MIKVLPLKTAKEVVAKERERKTRTTLLMALLEDHLAKFHLIADAKEMLEAIKSGFGGNDESKKMQKYLLKKQFKGFSVSSSEGLHKEYDRFQTLLMALIMRTKPGLDTLSFDDLYNNLRVFERDVKYTTASSTIKHNMAFVFSESTSSTNNVSTAFSVSSSSVSKSQQEGSSSYTNEVIHSFFANQSSAPELDYDDLEPKWNASIVIRWGILPKSAELKGAKTTKGEMLEHIDWSGHVEEDAKNYAMISYSNSSSDNEVQSCSQACADSCVRLKKLYDEQRDKLGDACVEITSYTLALKKVEAQLLYDSIICHESDLEDTPVNDRYADGMHVVPPPMIGNYMPSGHDVEIDYSKFTYGPKQNLANESYSKPSEYASCESNSSVETTTSMPELVDNAPKVVYEHKVWTDAHIIEEYKSDCDNDSVSNVQEDKEQPSFAFSDSDKHVKTSRENVKETCTPNHGNKIKKQYRNGNTRKGLGYAFTRKACFVCGSFSHLIRDCDFHEKRMAKQAELTKSKNKVTGQRENRPASSINCTASKVNTARPFVNDTRPKRHFYKTHSPNKSPFHNKAAQRTTVLSHKVNTVNTSLSVVKGNWDTAVKASAGCNLRNKRNTWNKVFKYNSGSKFRKSVKDPLGRLKSEMAWVPKRK
nr:ribonuclease H-like domain-containing protein [Tanacetum cinerariifolium]